MDKNYEYITSCPYCGFPADVDMDTILTSYPSKYKAWCKQESCGESSIVFANEIMRRRIDMSREELFELGKTLEFKIKHMNTIAQNDMPINEKVIEMYKQDYMEVFDSLMDYDEQVTKYLNWQKSEAKRNK